MAAGEKPKNVAEFLDGIQNDSRREDSRALIEVMREVTGEEPKLWGAMVGFGDYHYRYESGREGDYFKVGFAPRAANLTIYLMSGVAGYDDLLQKLGPHKTGKSCLYVKRLGDLDRDVLAELIRRSVDHIDDVQGGAEPSS